MKKKRRLKAAQNKDSLIKVELLADGSSTVCDLASLRNDRRFVDAEFCVQGVTFTAHRNLLSSASSYFRALFCGDMKTKPGAVVTLVDMDASSFSSLLDHIYQRHFQTSRKNAGLVLVAADRLQLWEAKGACEIFLATHVDAQSVWDMYELADSHNCPLLQKAVQEFCSIECTAALSTIEDASEEAVLWLLQSDDLIVSEFELYKAVMHWGDQSEMPPLGSAGNIDAAVQMRLLAYVRFPLMLASQLLKCEEEGVPQAMLFRAYRWLALGQERRVKEPESFDTRARKHCFWKPGVHLHVPISDLCGWRLWRKVGYSEEGTLPAMVECPGSLILIASMLNAEPEVLQLVAMGRKAIILGGPPIRCNREIGFTVGVGSLIEENGVFWYHTFTDEKDGCFGFSPEPLVYVRQDIHDTKPGDKRLSWHVLRSGVSGAGYRSGNQHFDSELGNADGADWTKAIYYML